VGIGGRQVQTIADNGEYMPPTLRWHPGGSHRAYAAQFLQTPDEFRR